MNLADAIRKAAQSSDPLSSAKYNGSGFEGNPAVTPAPTHIFSEHSTYVSKTVDNTNTSQEVIIETEDLVEIVPPRNDTLSSASSSSQGPSTTVRVELDLAPDQLSSLMKSIVVTQHSVMTLREAAQFLRIPGSTLERLAEAKQVPGFKFEGKWRFARTAVEAWLTNPELEDLAS